MKTAIPISICIFAAVAYFGIRPREPLTTRKTQDQEIESLPDLAIAPEELRANGSPPPASKLHREAQRDGNSKADPFTDQMIPVAKELKETGSKPEPAKHQLTE